MDYPPIRIKDYSMKLEEFGYQQYFFDKITITLCRITSTGKIIKNQW